MISQSIRKAMVLMTALVLLSSAAFSETRYERDLVVKDETRAMKVEKVFKELIAAYEDEDPQGFLELVSDDRFRQDYITFTDALYSDFRNYEIHRVDYWIDRVVSDHIKQFLFVKWEKRYETLESGRQNTLSGYSRFLFDEINGNYLLIELAGNPLFGGSLQEWREETPPISGQVVPVAAATKITTDPGPVSPGTGNNTLENLCSITNLGQCLAQADCEGAGGYWGAGSCYATPKDACDAENRYWYNGMCNSTPSLPDLTILKAEITNGTGSTADFAVTIRNNGPIASGPFKVQMIHDTGMPAATETISNLDATSSTTITMIAPMGLGDLTIIVDSDHAISESDESNNSHVIPDMPW
ncbi:hypothetical protein DSLASN_31050 [Desulfoluna limicola]|uniref:CARDB domain-containing protein n=1 Tax=Desulfoluna limicola TaxID=2810562 RepID=A0ABM7PK73_9BACT|nr:CARDB domain-containing protein [Desulfoluna limicola]BCS97473.1 hypothetical protein DSLASN_31050 [Desulfoluna limicola]